MMERIDHPLSSSCTSKKNHDEHDVHATENRRHKWLLLTFAGESFAFCVNHKNELTHGMSRDLRLNITYDDHDTNDEHVAHDRKIAYREPFLFPDLNQIFAVTNRTVLDCPVLATATEATSRPVMHEEHAPHASQRSYEESSVKNGSSHDDDDAHRRMTSLYVRVEIMAVHV
jgi:hypothetical protein